MSRPWISNHHAQAIRNAGVNGCSLPDQSAEHRWRVAARSAAEAVCTARYHVARSHDCCAGGPFIWQPSLPAITLGVTLSSHLDTLAINSGGGY